MSKSYTPGLKILKNTTIIKERILPLKGRVHVESKDKVDSDTIVASTNIPGNVHMVNLVNELNIDAEQSESCMLFKVGDSVKKEQILAQNKGLFGMFKSEVKSPVDGIIENISNVTGQLVISEKPIPIEMDAYIPGIVNNVFEEEGAIIKSEGTYIQGIIGIGGEKKGILKVLADSGSDVLDNSCLSTDLKNCIVVCGSYIDYSFYNKCSEIGIKGIICGGFDYDNISEILGYPLGVAITGTENTATLIITEGFGRVNMAERTFDLFKKNNEMLVSINGATQIRAGVMRPEIFIAKEGNTKNIKELNDEDLVISISSAVRVIRKPYFGKIGKVVELPHDLMKMESETQVRVAVIEFPDQTTKIIPRANLEVILSD